MASSTPVQRTDHDAGDATAALLAELRADGWDPIPIADPPGFRYPPHRHAATKLLAVLTGSMTVETGGRSHALRPGDRLIVPSQQEHEALVGPEGCTFLWSEQIRE
jgi:mannose-6-phosphate isomerase-like protein (cupin superfamily)